MTELLFKLKKGGKCVGYMKITHGVILVASRESVEHRSARLWEPIVDWDCEKYRIDFDSIHRFVCTDRTGKDVYEGDTVKVYRNAGRHRFSEGQGTVEPPAGPASGYWLAVALWPHGCENEKREGGVLCIDEQGTSIELVENEQEAK